MLFKTALRLLGIYVVILFSPPVFSAEEPQFATVSPLMSSSNYPEAENGQASGNTPPLASAQQINDPYENVNRSIFSFNDALDTYFLVPVSTFYNHVMPRPLNRGIYNFFSNLNNFPTIGNDILQGNFYQATSDSWRFFVNSTAGVGGLFDVANNMGLEQNNEDFGLTLARWGYADSSYFVIPFFGPSTIRDAIGLPMDYFFFSPYTYVGNSRMKYTLYALNIVSKRAHLLQYQDLYNQIALDRYVFIRNAYLQQRQNAIERNQNLSDPYFNISPK